MLKIAIALLTVGGLGTGYFIARSHCGGECPIAAMFASTAQASPAATNGVAVSTTADVDADDVIKEPTTVPTTSPTTAPSDAAVNKYCAVTKDEEVDQEIFVMHDGKKIGFCCKGCIDPFKKDPEKYLKDLK